MKRQIRFLRIMFSPLLQTLLSSAPVWQNIFIMQNKFIKNFNSSNNYLKFMNTILSQGKRSTSLTQDYFSSSNNEKSLPYRSHPRLQVTVDIFSGRPNPSWILSESDSRMVSAMLLQNPAMLDTTDSGFDGLGFRGLEFSFVTDTGNLNLPDRFKLANGRNFLTLLDELDIAKRIVGKMDEYKHIDPLSGVLTPLNSDIKNIILEDISKFPEVIAKRRFINQIETESIAGLQEVKPQAGEKPVKDLMSDLALQKCFFELGRFNPNFWNAPQRIRRNNCYNYARNHATNTFAQPGNASGYVRSSLVCREVSEASVSDGAKRSTSGCLPESEKDRWYTALVVNPKVDYHWYRLHTGGAQIRFWGHKPGKTKAKNTDNSGKVIKEPYYCDRGGYTHFCGYFYMGKSMTIR